MQLTNDERHILTLLGKTQRETEILIDDDGELYWYGALGGWSEPEMEKMYELPRGSHNVWRTSDVYAGPGMGIQARRKTFRIATSENLNRFARGVQLDHARSYSS